MAPRVYRILQVAPSGFSTGARWHPARAVRRAWLADVITEIHVRSRRTYGWRRVRAKLADGYGQVVNKKLIRVIMGELGIAGLPNRLKPKPSSVHRATTEDLVNRDFARNGPNQLWMTDITASREGASERKLSARLYLSEGVPIRRRPGSPLGQATSVRGYALAAQPRQAATPVRTPYIHRCARRLARAGIRGASRYWAIAERLHPITAGPASFNGITMQVRPGEYGSLNMYRGLYERAEVKVLSRILKPGMTAVDVGANVGFYTRLFARQVGPDGRVEAFEPNPVCWPSLAHLPPNVRLHRQALGDHTGTAKLRNIGDADHTLHATLVNFSAFAENPGVFRETTVEVRTLDDALDGLGIHKVDVLKIDVEGFDAQVLYGATRLIAEGRVGHILVEVSPEYVPVDFVNWLIATAGPQYQASRVAEQGWLIARPVLRPVGGETRQYNLLLSRGSAPPG